MSQIIYEWLMIIAGIIFFVIYFGYGPYERNRMRIKHSKIPDDLAEIMTGLPEVWQLIAYEWHGDNWSAKLSYGDRRFSVSTDYGYPGPIYVEEIDGDVPPILSSPLTHRWQRAGGPKEMHVELAKLKPPKEN